MVMLLPLDDIASATSFPEGFPEGFPEVTHIVLLDPVTGTPARIRATEQQAIGCVHHSHKHVRL